MIQTQWVDFTITDGMFGEEQLYTKDRFEEMTDDKFEAVEVNDDGFPIRIWMTGSVYSIVSPFRTSLQPVIVGAPRNWVRTEISSSK